MKKYGLQLRVPPPAKKPLAAPGAASAPPRPPPPVFGDDGDDDVEREIARQALKSRQDKQVEAQYRKALEEDPSVFDYDGVYDEMKGNIARPKVQDKVQREAKYIPKLLDASKRRTLEQDIVYEKKLLKERQKEDHLYADKPKFLTAGYKKKLQAREQWEAEERMRQIQEEKEDVTKKKDLSDFYFNLSKNVAYGAKEKESTNLQSGSPTNQPGASTSKKVAREDPADLPGHGNINNKESDADAYASREGNEAVNVKSPAIDASTTNDHEAASTTTDHGAAQSKVSEEQYKRNEDALAAAQERYRARKKARRVDGSQ